MSLRIIVVLTVGILIGALTTYFLVPKGPSTSTASAESQLYSCGMHPEVLSEEPGDCPICGMRLTPVKSTGQESSKPKGERKILYWRAPMDPTEIYDQPGKSKMGMDLVPVYEGEEAGGAGSISIDGAIQQNMNLRTAMVERRDISRVIRAYGKVTYAEDKQFSVNTKISGWIEKLYVNTAGQRVRKGEPLLEIYSPELVSTQEEYLLALRNKEKMASSSERVRQGAETMLSSARSRLEFWDISKGEIDKTEQTGQVRRTTMLRAPINGVVTHKAIVEGDKVMPGMDLFHIADLSKIWVEATVYESELPLIKKGRKAELELDYLQGTKIEGKVDFIYPYLDQKTRAVNVRLVFSNPNELLKPGMYATVRIYSKVANNALTIPSESVIHSGERKIVFVSKDDGKFEPREIKLGGESDDGYIQVVSGLFEHEKVVSSGQFLLDSESRTREAIAKMRAARQQTLQNLSIGEESSGQESEHEEQNETAVVEYRHKGHGHAEHQQHDKELYACPMHPDFITSDPEGRCSECGMKLTNVSELGDKVKPDQAEFYTCPMHPDFVTTDKDERCPECGMKLEKNK